MGEAHWRDALRKTRRRTFGRLSSFFGATELSSELWQELEMILIEADLGVVLVQDLITTLQGEVAAAGETRGEQVQERLRAHLLSAMPSIRSEPIAQHPAVILLIGVNGSGKTTVAARLAQRNLVTGKRVLLAAADTYRAAAAEQLGAWGDELGIDVIAGQTGADPGAVVYDACHAALARGVDTLIIDTSGRMHTEHNLMAELQKIYRVAGGAIEGAPHEVLLVLDATTGQNGLAQAKAFAETIEVDGVILAKLDTSAKGGVGFAVTRALGVPIRYVGTGESINDLSPFDPLAFVDGLLASPGVEREATN